MSRSSETPILALGSSNFFVARLCGELRRYDPSLRFDVVDYVRYGDAVDFDESIVFEQQLVTRPFRRDFQSLYNAVRALVAGDLPRRLAVTCLLGNHTDRSKTAIRLAIQGESLLRDIVARRPYSLCHVHSCTPLNLAGLDRLPRTTKLICSFWGSDLLRVGSMLDQWQIRRVLHRADRITVQSPELREVLLATHGRDLADKTCCCRFPVQPDLYGRLDQRTDPKTSTETRTVVIGHNGNPANRHLEVIAALARLPRQEKQRIRFVVPIAYAPEADYVKSIRDAAHAHDLRVEILDGFLDWDRLAELRASAHDYLHFPISDALSHTVTEYIYAGARVYVGAWLPYGPFRRAGLPFAEVEDLDRLPEALFSRHPADDISLAARREAVRANFFNDAVMPAWHELYASLLHAPA
jgi:hypothetical protein